MKKLLALLLALLLVFSFAACGSGSSEDKDTSKEDAPEIFGTVNGKVYENEFIGIGCVVPADWEFYSDSQIAELNKATYDYMSDEYKDYIKNATLFYDMFVQEADGYNNVNVILEKVNKETLKNLDIAKNFQAVFSQAKTALENMGYTDVTLSVEDKKVCGEVMPVAYITAEIGGVTLSQAQFCIKCDGYLASVTISDYNGSLEQLLDAFYALD